MKKPTRSVLRYPGGKFRIGSWIIEKFPEHKVYVEPFCGAASLLFLKEPAITEVINDLNDDVFNVFTVLRNVEASKRLKELIRLTPYSRREYELCYEPFTCDTAERARRYICRACFSQRKGPLKKSGFDTRINGDGYCGRVNYKSDYHNQIDLFTERLQNVVVESRPAEVIIDQFDRSDTLFYLDPPYIGVDNFYPVEFSFEDHVKLLKQLQGLSAMAIISGYKNDLYKQMLELNGWERYEKNAYADGGFKRIECIWINPAAQKPKSQKELFS